MCLLFNFEYKLLCFYFCSHFASQLPTRCHSLNAQIQSAASAPRLYSTNYFEIALNNFSFPSFPKSDQTPVLQDKAECASAGQVFNGFGLSEEALTVLLDLLRSER